MSKKRALDTFFTPSSQKKVRLSSGSGPIGTSKSLSQPDTDQPLSDHPSYPYPVRHLPQSIQDAFSNVPMSEGREINDQPDLDLLYFQPFIPPSIERELFEFLRKELFFYRVKYKIKRGTIETEINTPRYTTVFGVDATSRFSSASPPVQLDATTSKPVPPDRYSCKPRPLPQV